MKVNHLHSVKVSNAKEAEKEIRATAKKAGLTFKKQDAFINGAQAYKFTDRATGETKLSNCTFWTAYENCLSGYVESYSASTGSFSGI